MVSTRSWARAGSKKSRKTHPQLKITGVVRVLIVEAKEKYNYGPKKMSLYLKEECETEVSPSAIYKFFKKRKLIRKPQKKQEWYTPMKEPFYAQRPGENVQLDVSMFQALTGAGDISFAS
ncbi:MAG: hypothetical protein ABH826_04055 [Patescibacteria group bacterium]